MTPSGALRVRSARTALASRVWYGSKPMRPVFADLKTDFVFKKVFGSDEHKVFGSDEHKDILIALLNALLGLEGERTIVDVTYLREEERPKVEELKHSIVDVKCRDARGTFFVVEMQVLNVEGFEKRVVYNASKAYVNQIGKGEEYPHLDDMIALSICDFVLWPDAPGQPKVPLVSRWRMQEQHNGRRALGQIQYAFVELPKLPADQPPHDLSEEWAYVFRKAPILRDVPDYVQHEGPRRALEAARVAHFTPEEWEVYDRAKVAEQDARGAITLAETRGMLAQSRATLLRVFERRKVTLSPEHRARVEACDDLKVLDGWIDRAVDGVSVEEVFAA